MQKEFVPFALPDIDEEEVKEVIKTLKSGWLTSGPKVKEFEDNFKNFIHPNLNAIAVNSATAGLHLALEAIGIKKGDQVITTTHTFTATAEVIRYLGADPIFIDINPDTLCIDEKKIENAITNKTKAIIPVHFAGLPSEMDYILNLAEKYNLKIIEDAAHALPCFYKNKMIGNLDSDITVFSFYANKTMTTGEGGMVVTKNKTLAERIRIMRLHGIDRDVYDRYSTDKPKWGYQVVAPGYKYNMTDLAASIGLVQLKKVNDFRLKREKIASIYNEEFKNLPIILPPQPIKNSSHSWHLYVIRLSSECKLNRDDVIDKLFKLGIGCSVHYIPLHNHTYWKNKYRLNQFMFPESQKAFELSISLPIYSKMNDIEISKVFSTLKKLIKI